MAKLTKREKEKIRAQFEDNQRGSTWVGIRPTVFMSDKYNKKRRRAASKHVAVDD